VSSSLEYTGGDCKALGFLGGGYEGRLVENEDLREKSVAEWLPGNGGGLERRIRSFEKWLTRQPEERIVVVGHSQYFKKMLDWDCKFGNCDVWKMDLEWREEEGGGGGLKGEEKEEKNVEVEWKNVVKMYEFDWGGGEEGAKPAKS